MLKPMAGGMKMLKPLFATTPAVCGVIALMLTTFSPTAVHAGVYKCLGPDGGTTYSQVPCAAEDTSSTVTEGIVRKQKSQDCRIANAFASETAVAMRRGTTSEQTFGKHGGIDSLSPTVVSLISYVYSFKSTPGVSADRIAGLSRARCQAGSFGDTSCENFPLRYIANMGGCEMAAEQPLNPTQQNPAAAMPQQDVGVAPADDKASDAKRAAMQQQACVTRIKNKLKSLEKSMRSTGSASQHDSLNAQRRQMKKALSKCG